MYSPFQFCGVKKKDGRLYAQDATDAFERGVTLICERYTGYRLEDFYGKSYREGGITLSQMTVMIQHAADREEERLRFDAGIPGITLSGDGRRPAEAKKENDDDDVLFLSPEEYEKMTPEDRKRLQEKLMKKFSGFVGNLGARK